MLHRCRKLVVVLELAAVVAVHAVGEAEPALDLTLREVALDDLRGDLGELLVALGLLLHVLRDALALDGVDVLAVGLVDGGSLERFDILGHLGLLKGDVGVDDCCDADEYLLIVTVAYDATLPALVDRSLQL